MANRFWVLGSGNWDATTTHWSTTSGGGGGASVPTSADVAIFDVNSNTGTTAFTVTVVGTRTCLDVSISGLDGAMTLAGSTTPILNVVGSWASPATNFSIASTFTTLNFTSTATGRTIQFNGYTIPATTAIAFTGTGGGWTLSSALTTLGSTAHNAGTLTLNNFTLSTASYSSATATTRVLAFGTTGAITVTGVGGVDFSTVTGFSFTGTSALNISVSGAFGPAFSLGSFTEAQSLNFNITTGTYALSISGPVRNFNTTGFTGTYAAASLTITTYGDVTFGSGSSFATSNFNDITFAASSGTQVLTANTVAVSANLIIANTGTGTVQLGSNITGAGTPVGSLTLTTGTFNANNFNVTLSRFASSNTNTRTLTMGSGTWTLTTYDSLAIPWDCTTSTGLTVNANTSTIKLNQTVSSVTATFAGGGKTYNILSLSGSPGSATYKITGANTFDTLTSDNTIAYTVTLPASTTTTITNFSLVSSGSSSLLTLNSSTAGTQATLSKSTGTVNVYFATVTDNIATGGATWNLLSGTNSNTTGWNLLTYTAYWVGGSGTWDSTTTHWANSSGGTAGTPAPNSASNAVIDANSGSPTITLSATPTCKDFSTTGATCTITGSGDFYVSGNFTLSATTTWTHTGYLRIRGPSSAVVTTNGVTLAAYVLFGFSGGAFTLGSALTTTNSIEQSSGTLTLNGFNLTCKTYAIFSTSCTIAFGTSQIFVTGNAATVWSTVSTTTTGTPLVNFTYSGATGTRTITATTASFSFNITAGTDIITQSGSVNNIDFTGFSGTLSNSTRSIYGDLKTTSGMTLTAGALVTTFAATSGTKTITTAGKTFDFPVTFNGVGGTWQLQDALTVGTTRTTTLTNGAIDLNNFNLTSGTFSSNTANTRTIAFGTGQIFVTGNNAGVVAMGTLTGLTITGTPVFNSSYSGATGTRIINYGTTAGGTEATSASFNITAGSDTFTFGTGSVVRDLNFTGFSGTLSNNTKSIYGNLTISSGMTLTAGANTQTFAATSGTKTITTAGKTLDFPLTFNGAGGTFQFQDALTQGSTRTFNFLAGTVQLKDGVTSTVGSFLTTGTTLKYLRSSVSGIQAIISQASGTVTATYLDIQDSNATGGATWDATAASNVNSGNTVGWTFATGDITVVTTGVNATTAIGNTAVTGGSNVSLTGPPATSALGTVTTTTIANISVTGNVGITALGTVSVSGVGFANPTGVVGTTALGTVNVPNISFVITGVQSTGAIGTVTAGGATNVAVTGVVGTTGLGTTTQSGGSLVSVTGLQATTALGTVIYPNASFNTTGVVGTTALGTTTQSGTSLYTATGLQGTTALGTTTQSGTALFSVTGLQATTALGTTTQSGTSLYTATGLQGTTAVGNVTVAAGGNISFSVSSVTGTGVVGNLIVPNNSFVVTGVVGTTALGTTTVSQGVGISLTGVVGTTALGTVTYPNASFNTTGVTGTTALGITTQSGTSPATVTGVVGTTAIGTYYVTGDALASATKVTGTTALGTVALPNDAASVTKVTGTGVIGTLTVTGTAAFSVTSNVGTTALGSVSVGQGTGASVTKVTGTGAIGTSTVTTTNVYSLTGVQATGSTGVVTLRTDNTLSVTGVQGTGVIGQSVASISINANLTGVYATGRTGNITSISGDANVSTIGVVGYGQLSDCVIWSNIVAVSTPNWTTIDDMQR